MTALLWTPVKVLRMVEKNGMKTGAGLRAPAASESWVSTLHWTLLPSEPAFTASRVDWYDPVDPPLVNLPARGLADGTPSENVWTPPPNESIWFTAPRMFAVLRSKSLTAPFAATIPSRDVVLRTPNRPTKMFAAEAPMTPFRSLATTSGRAIVVVAFTKFVREPRSTM